MKCYGGMKDCSMSTNAITTFLESRRYSSNATLAITSTCKNINSQKKFKIFCVNIFYDTKKHTSRIRTCNNSRYNTFFLCLERENALRINLTFFFKGRYIPKPTVAFCTNLFKEASQKRNMLTLCQTHHFKLYVNICDAKLVSIKFHKIKRVVQFKHVIQDNTHKPKT